MHEMIHRTLATEFERDRLTAASDARTRRSLEPAGGGAQPRRRFALRVAALRPRRIGAGQ
jgi:hypothetical protein